MKTVTWFAPLFALAVAQSAAAAPTAIPDADSGGADLPWLKRYAGSVIVDFRHVEFDEADFVAGPLEPADGRDKSNNRLRLPARVESAQGALTRYVYLLPEGRSPLEAVEGYREEFEADGGAVVHSCKETGCGGAPGNGVTSGGGEQGLINHVFPRDQMPTKLFSPGFCVLRAKNTGQRYVYMNKVGGGSSAHLSVFAAQVSDNNTDCRAFDKRTFAIVTVVEEKPRVQNMATVTAEEIDADIAKQGRVAVYGVHFDFDKADIKPESEPQLVQIAGFLKSHADSEYLVVGHTDNKGGIDYNVDLSDRRAAAVVRALVGAHGVGSQQLIGLGVGMAAPVSTNATDEGRALNRRVEIVAR